MVRASSYAKDYRISIFLAVHYHQFRLHITCPILSVFTLSTNDMVPALDIYNTSTINYGMNGAIGWWIPATILVGGYFYNLHRTFKGKLGDVEYH